jgi:hypothetical protein
MIYNLYTVNISTNPGDFSNLWEDELFRSSGVYDEEIAEIVGKATAELLKQFPGINVTVSGKYAGITGPDDTVRGTIDQWLSGYWSRAL